MTIDAEPEHSEVGLSIIPVPGELDDTAIDQVLHACDVELSYSDTESLVIDLAAVQSVDSAAVDALVRISEAAEQYDVDFNVHNAAEDVREPLEQAGLTPPTFGFPRTATDDYSPRH